MWFVQRLSVRVLLLCFWLCWSIFFLRLLQTLYYLRALLFFVVTLAFQAFCTPAFLILCFLTLTFLTLAFLTLAFLTLAIPLDTSHFHISRLNFVAYVDILLMLVAIEMSHLEISTLNNVAPHEQGTQVGESGHVPFLDWSKRTYLVTMFHRWWRQPWAVLLIVERTTIYWHKNLVYLR